MKTDLTQYTEDEFKQFIEKIFKENASSTDDNLDPLLDLFEEMTQHPDGSDLIYYPENEGDDTPERIVEIVKEWRASQGLPGFKND